ncbi:unannotated protein [freshwater metagenome]|uniref:Unannotated protein n=1 Tax=freshwater metagenome TaxID=449393 RepID=A0A6J7ETC9_9ZZZZ
MGKSALSCPENVWDQVGFGLVVLTTRTAGSSDIEVPQRDCPKPVGCGFSGDHSVNSKFALAVRVDRTRWAVLCDWHNLRLSITSAGGGEDEALDPIGPHRIEQIEGASDVVAPVELWLGDRLANKCEGRAVKYSVKPTRQSCGQTLQVEQVALDQLSSGRDGSPVPARKVVQHNNIVASGHQGPCAHGADITRTTCNEKTHPGEAYSADAIPGDSGETATSFCDLGYIGNTPQNGCVGGLGKVPSEPPYTLADPSKQVARPGDMRGD